MHPARHQLNDMLDADIESISFLLFLFNPSSPHLRLHATLWSRQCVRDDMASSRISNALTGSARDHCIATWTVATIVAVVVGGRGQHPLERITRCPCHRHALMRRIITGVRCRRHRGGRAGRDGGVDESGAAVQRPIIGISRIELLQETALQVLHQQTVLQLLQLMIEFLRVAVLL